MSDTDNNNDTVEIEAAEKVQSIGQVLQAARLVHGMNIQDVARQLRLAARQVKAIEEDDHSKFPSRTFLHGFIRNYAKLVQVDTVEFSHLLQQTLPLVSSQAISYPVEGTAFTSIHKQSRSSPILVWGAVLASMLLIYEVYRGGGEDQQSDVNVEIGTMAENMTKSETEDKQAVEKTQLQLPLAVKSIDPDAVQLTEEEGMAQQKNNNLFSTQQIATQTVATHEPVKNGEGVIHFVFDEESWVEVIDAEGKKILSRTNLGNTEKMVYGKPPFSLTIGNAANVKLDYNSKSVNLTPYIRNGGVARLSLE
jgi:cytoskeleton protein RodZ